MEIITIIIGIAMGISITFIILGFIVNESRLSDLELEVEALKKRDRSTKEVPNSKST